MGTTLEDSKVSRGEVKPRLLCALVPNDDFWRQSLWEVTGFG
jgi:hypothetical protein